jgi:hypothetical protein
MSKDEESATNDQPSKPPTVTIQRRLRLVDKTAPITQARLKRFFELQQEYEEAKRQFEAFQAHYFAEREALALRAIAGAPIRTGVFKPRFKKYKQRHPRYKDGFIRVLGEERGKAAQQDILENTPWTTHLGGWVE